MTMNDIAEHKQQWKELMAVYIAETSWKLTIWPRLARLHLWKVPDQIQVRDKNVVLSVHKTVQTVD